MDIFRKGLKHLEHVYGRFIGIWMFSRPEELQVYVKFITMHELLEVAGNSGSMKDMACVTDGEHCSRYIRWPVSAAMDVSTTSRT